MKYSRAEAKEAAREQCRGVWVASALPFTDDLEIDEDGLVRNTRYLIEELKVDGIFCAGVMSEFWSLTTPEWKRAIELVVKAADGDCGVIAHTGHHSAAQTVELTRHAEEVGADFAIIVTPYFPQRTLGGVYDWFEYVCERVDIGVWLFDAIYAQNKLPAELLSDIADFENVCGMKQPWELEHYRKVHELCSDRMIISQPHEDHWLSMMRDFNQPVLMASPTPALYQRPGALTIREYTELARNGEWDKAEEVSARLAPYRRLRSRFWTEAARTIMPIAYIKEWYSLLGMAAGPVRPPLQPLTAEERQDFRDAFAEAGVLADVEGAAAVKV